MIKAIRRTRIITSLILLLAISLSLSWNLYHFKQHQVCGKTEAATQETRESSLPHWPLIFSHLAAAIAGLIIISSFADKLSRERRRLEESHDLLQQEVGERRKSEEALRAIKEELEERVKKRTQALEQTNAILNESLEAQQRTEQSLSHTTRELRRSNRELSDFTHAISHDLKEPLILIQAFCDRIQQHCRDDLNQKGHHYLAQVTRSTGRMQDLIDGLLVPIP